MATNANSVSIEKLTGRDNWSSWSFAVKAYLQLEELWEIVEGTVCDTKKDVRTKSKLILLIHPSLYVHVREAKTAKEVWKNLSNAFEDSGLLRKVGLLRELINSSLDSSSSTEEYVNKIMSAAHKLRNIGFMVDDEWLGTLMLTGLPEEYKPMIMGIESSGVKISADLIKNKLLQEVKKSDTTAFYTNSKSNNYGKNNQQPSKSKGPRCFTCNKHGHLSKNCWHRKNKLENKSTDKNGFIAAFSASVFNDSTNWYVDSGASLHMTMHREWLEDETAPPVNKIRIADNKELHVESCGNVTIQVPTSSGTSEKIQVRNVLYVPDLSTNLLSVSKMIKSGCKVEFDKNGCLIYNLNGKKVAQASLLNDMYKLNVYNSNVCAMAANNVPDTYLWHQRMGHLNFADVNKLTNCASGVKLSPQKNEYVCISCLEGKQTRQPFPNEGSRANDLLERIHTDVCGPMQTASMGGARYFLTFTDDFSRKVFVYFIKSKGEVLEKFIEFKNSVENQLNKKIKVLRSDNGTEYINKNFDTYLKKCGIMHQTSNPYTPQQNGLSERMNRTLIERAKCMIINANLQKEFWAEAVVTAAHIINRSPTRSLSDRTPEELWTGEKPDLSHMRVFGCKAMVYVPKEKRQKLDVKSRELIFVGYSNCTKGYRFIDPETKKAIISRDVVFLETTVKRNFVSNSIPETEKEKSISTEKVQEKVEIKKNEVYLPSMSSRSDEASENNDNVLEIQPTTVSTPITLSDTSSTSLYEDPDDDTYIPDETLDTPPDYVTTRRRRRENEPLEMSYMCMNGESTTSLLDSDPQSLDEALNSTKADKWKEAMNEEYQSLIENNTWSLVDLPKEKKIIPCKWVFKTKTDENGNVNRYKARLVIKGYKQTKGIDYHEIYAPVVRYSSIRYLIGLAAKYKLKIHQMDAITAFLQGDINEEIFMSQPPSYEYGEQVCRLNKCIYGLKQASRQWNKKLNAALLEIGMSRSRVDPCIYYRIINEKDILFITVYVDDLLYLYNNEDTVLMMKTKLNEKFQMKDLGVARCCIGFRIIQDTNTNEISLDQSLYIDKILSRFNMSNCKPVYTPCEPKLEFKKAEQDEEVLANIPYQEVIGCLLYLSQGTRPDIAYAVNTLSRFNNKPTAQHWVAVKRILRYLKGSISTKLVFKSNSNNIVGYCDADWATNTEDRRSCSGYVFIFQGAAISWCSKRQPTIALSSTEAEYMSLATAIQEAIWLKQLEEDFWPGLSGTPITIYCDNQSAISISGNDIYHARSKHIDVRYHFVRERISSKQVCVYYKSTQEMVADALTKGLHRPKHEMFNLAMGLRPEEAVEL